MQDRLWQSRAWLHYDVKVDCLQCGVRLATSAFSANRLEFVRGIWRAFTVLRRNFHSSLQLRCPVGNPSPSFCIQPLMYDSSDTREAKHVLAGTTSVTPNYFPRIQTTWRWILTGRLFEIVHSVFIHDGQAFPYRFRRFNSVFTVLYTQLFCPSGIGPGSIISCAQASYVPSSVSVGILHSSLRL